MKTDAELEQIFDELWHNRPILKRDARIPAMRLLRSIQIDALRHAREMIAAPMRVFDGNDDAHEVSHPALAELEKLIRELELK